MLSAQPVRETSLTNRVNQPRKALLVSNDPFCISTIQEAVRPLLSNICIATNHQDVNSVLAHTEIFPVVIIDTACTDSPCDLTSSIKSKWPECELILVSDDISSWIELIQRGAYDILPKPVTSPDLTWTVTGALLKQSPVKAMRAAS